MNPKDQLTNSNDYTPSKRASAAVRTATGNSGAKPDSPDMGNVPAPSEADQPSDQHTGGKVVNNTQKGDTSFEQPDGGRGKVEKGGM